MCVRETETERVREKGGGRRWEEEGALSRLGNFKNTPKNKQKLSRASVAAPFQERSGLGTFAADSSFRPLLRQPLEDPAPGFPSLPPALRVKAPPPGVNKQPKLAASRTGPFSSFPAPAPATGPALHDRPRPPPSSLPPSPSRRPLAPAVSRLCAEASAGCPVPWPAPGASSLGTSRAGRAPPASAEGGCVAHT